MPEILNMGTKTSLKNSIAVLIRERKRNQYGYNWSILMKLSNLSWKSERNMHYKFQENIWKISVLKEESTSIYLNLNTYTSVWILTLKFEHVFTALQVSVSVPSI